MRALWTAGLTMGAGALAARAWRRKQQAISLAGRTVLITGGSRGLGLTLARAFGEHGARIALLARTEEDLDHAVHDLQQRRVQVFAVPCDLTDPDAVTRTVDTVATHYNGLDVVVHNAGVIQVGPLAHMQRADFEESLAVHFWGGYNVIQAALPYLPRPGGRIVNITSIGGHIAVPHLVPYAVGKFALVGFSDGIRAELEREGIYVTTVNPGLMRTGSHVNALFKGRHRDEFAWFSMAAAFPLLSTTAEHAARAIVDACRHGDPSLTITLPARLAVGISRMAPGLIAAVTARTAAWLPGVTAGGDKQHSGWESTSDKAPSRLTRPADREVAAHNELRGHTPPG